MRKNRPNMLEAFRDSAAQSAKAEAVRQPKGPSFRNVFRPGGDPPSSGGMGPSGGAGGPFAAPKGPAKKGKKLRATQVTSIPLAPHAIVFLLLLALAGTFWLGRRSVPSKVAAAGIGGALDPSAGESGDSSGTGSAATYGSPTTYEIDRGTDGEQVTGASAPAASSGAEYSPADLAFMDGRNTYTIQAIAYGTTDNERELAWGVHAHLQGLGLPVVTPYRSGGKLYVFIGASKSTADLRELQKEVIAATGPRGKQPFSTAIIVPIANFQ